MYKTFRITAILIVIALVAGSLGAFAALAGVGSQPTYGTATVDGDAGEWDLTNDLFTEMFRAGDPNKDVLANAYLRYECPVPPEEYGTLFVLVLPDGTKQIFGTSDGFSEHWVKLDGSKPTLLSSGIAFINESSGKADGWEAAFDVIPGSYSMQIHTNIDDEGSQTAGNTVDLEIKCMDFGDLPNDPPLDYGMTTNADGGAYHLIGDLFLGATIDGEGDGQPHGSAVGDDNNGPDEDGVVLIPGDSWSDGDGTVKITVTVGTGCLMGWLDYWDGTGPPYERDGDFKDAGEVIIDNVYVVPGTHNFTFPLPNGAADGAVMSARFRLVPYTGQSGLEPMDECDQTALTEWGEAVGGEVEDYMWSFDPTAVALQSFAADSVSKNSVWMLAVLLITTSVLTLIWKKRRVSS